MSVTVATLLVVPLVAVYVNESIPEKPDVGVYVNDPSALTAAVPWEAGVVEFTVRPAPVSFERTPGAGIERGVFAAVR